MLYASIGWSVGATLGYAQAAPEKRVIACIGDGSFQVYSESSHRELHGMLIFNLAIKVSNNMLVILDVD